MKEVFDMAARTALIGVGATAVLDVWLLALKKAGVPTQNFAMLGRWIGHWQNRQWHHQAIAKASPVQGETWMGWLAHYAIGIAFSALMVSVIGSAWAASPTLAPAVMFGMVTVAAPLLVLQPALGAGVASSKTKAPLRNSFKSLMNHTVFGIGLYLAATAIDTVGG
jgi:hypothetical protein